MMHYFNNEVKTWPLVNNNKIPVTEEEKIKLVDVLQVRF